MKRVLLFCILVMTLTLTPELTEAQCVMCKAVAEDASTHTGVGKGINAGIIYLMGIPYLLLTILYFAFFRRKKISL